MICDFRNMDKKLICFYLNDEFLNKHDPIVLSNDSIHEKWYPVVTCSSKQVFQIL